VEYGVLSQLSRLKLSNSGGTLMREGGLWPYLIGDACRSLRVGPCRQRTLLLVRQTIQTLRGYARVDGFAERRRRRLDTKRSHVAMPLITDVIPEE
jgi:hypothetical protein